MIRALFNSLAAVCVLLGAQTLIGQTNLPSLQSTDAVNAFIQVQAQLHETQMLVDSNRLQTVAALERHSEALSTDIQLLEKAVADQRADLEKAVAEQRADAAESARGIEHMMLMVAGVGMLALAVVVVLVFLQLRTATRLIELAMSPGSPLGSARSLPVVENTVALPASARAALEFSNARLLGVIERLEKRILELEETVNLPLEEGHSSGFENGKTSKERQVADLLVEGQLFLDTNKPEKALQCFEEALAIEPKLADALIKKAAALEKMEKIEEAIVCYDNAIELGDSVTTALLQKGGMLNRLARYDEALQCYERALQTQEKKAASS
ncbi:MAG TPA: tetratricopeptide repeat protein [Candidatus Acidoferrum sp.]|nr:tetratricopeptide repeat protein [Candidatus Acidoferrum sp.]